jgi:outer membrane protein
MTMKKSLRLLILPGLLLSFTGYAQDTTNRAGTGTPGKWDLKRCVDYAVANNISIRQSDVQARIAKLTLTQSRWNQIPTLGVGTLLAVNSGHNLDPATYNLSTVTYAQSSWSVQSNVTLFNFFSIQNTIAANRIAWQAALANSDRLKNDISLNVANAYLQVLLAAEQANAGQLQLRLSQTQLETTRKQVKAGSLPELNAAELEAQVAQDSANYISLKGTIDQNVLTLKAYMDLDAAVAFEVDTPPVDQIPVEKLEDLQPETVYALAQYNQPLLKMDEFNVQSARKSAQANKGAMYPTFTLQGTLGAYYISTNQQAIQNPIPLVEKIGITEISRDTVITAVPAYNYKKIGYFSQLNQTFGQTVGLNVNIPILNNRILRTNFEKSKLNLRNNELQKDQDNLTLKENIYQAYTAVLTALHKFEANKVSVAATQKSFEYAQKRYNVGMLNTIDLLTNQNNYFNAKINALSSEYDYVFKLKVLEFYKGMGIKLN